MEAYTVVDGRITNSGKFEGQNAYMPTAYEHYLEGFCDVLSSGVIAVDVMVSGRIRTVRFVIDDAGFVREQ